MLDPKSEARTRRVERYERPSRLADQSGSYRRVTVPRGTAVGQALTLRQRQWMRRTHR